MQQIYQQEENILSRIISMLSMYHCLYLAQLCRLFPGVNKEQLTVLLRKLVRKGRLTLDSATGLVCYTGIKDADSATLSAVWLLLDFYPEITYHTICDYPVTLCFSVSDDCFDVIYVSMGKEQLLNGTFLIQRRMSQALSHCGECCSNVSPVHTWHRRLLYGISNWAGYLL